MITGKANYCVIHTTAKPMLPVALLARPCYARRLVQDRIRVAQHPTILFRDRQSFCSLLVVILYWLSDLVFNNHPLATLFIISFIVFFRLKTFIYKYLINC